MRQAPAGDFFLGVVVKLSCEQSGCLIPAVLASILVTVLVSVLVSILVSVLVSVLALYIWYIYQIYWYYAIDVLANARNTSGTVRTLSISIGSFAREAPGQACNREYTDGGESLVSSVRGSFGHAGHLRLSGAVATPAGSAPASGAPSRHAQMQIVLN